VRCAIFVDGEYLEKVRELRLSNIRIDFKKLADYLWRKVREVSVEDVALLRTYYYGALPYLPTTPTPQDRERYDNKHRFLKALEFHPRFEVRKGKVLRVYDDHGNADYVQKAVDVQLSIDLIMLAVENQIQHAVILAADDDFSPAVRIAKNESVVVHLAYCPKMPRGLDLEREADERIILDTPLIDTIKQY